MTLRSQVHAHLIGQQNWVKLTDWIVWQSGIVFQIWKCTALKHAEHCIVCNIATTLSAFQHKWCVKWELFYCPQMKTCRWHNETDAGRFGNLALTFVINQKQLNPQLTPTVDCRITHALIVPAPIGHQWPNMHPSQANTPQASTHLNLGWKRITCDQPSESESQDCWWRDLDLHQKVKFAMRKRATSSNPMIMQTISSEYL